jgi:hypothetical protein
MRKIMELLQYMKAMGDGVLLTNNCPPNITLVRCLAIPRHAKDRNRRSPRYLYPSLGLETTCTFLPPICEALI